MNIKLLKISTFIITTLLSLSSIKSFSQNMLEGIVTDNANKPISNCIINLSGTTNVKMSTKTDTLGMFKFSKVNLGRIIITINDLSFKPLKSELTLKKDTMLFFNLISTENSLLQVTINGSRPIFQRKIDRFIFNVSNSPIIQGSTLWDVLKQTPTVQANEPSSLKVLGNPDESTIFINGRKFPLSGDNLSNFLKNMPADNVIQIQILTIPPPSYDASGPVIDIILKHLETNGLKGSTTLTYEKAKTDRAKIGTLLDINKNKFNQSLLLSVTDGDYFKAIEKTTTFNQLTSSELFSNINLNTRRKGINAYTDISYNLSPVTTIGTQILYNGFALNTNGGGREIMSFGEINSPYNQNNISNNNLISGNSFFKYNSLKKSQYFEIGADYLRVKNQQKTQFLSEIDNIGFQTNSPQNITTYSVKADLASQIFKSVQLSSGFKYANSNVYTPYEAYTSKNSNFTKQDDLSANFTYDENVISAYTTVAKEFGKKWSAKVGLRLENTGIKTISQSVEIQRNKSAYTFIFPVGYINFSPNSNNSFSLTSKLSNNRPDYSALNPARSLLGSRTITEGNPFLKPSSAAVVEFMYSLNQAYYFGATYSRYNKLFTQLNQVIGVDTLLLKWQNWGNQSQINFWIFTSKSVLNEHLNFSINSNLGYYKRLYNENVTNSGNMSDNLQLNLTVNQSTHDFISKKLQLNLYSSFSTPQRYGLWKDTRCSFKVDFISSYDFTKLNLRLSLLVNDILKYNDRYVYTVNETNLQKTTVLNNNDSRSIRLSITKSFGNVKTRSFQKRDTSNEEERNRAQ